MQTTFDPVELSKAENQWLLDNLDKPLAVAFSQPLPVGVTRKAVRSVMEAAQELDELQQAGHGVWKGREAIKQAIQTWFTVDSKWEADWRRFRGRIPRYPSLYSFDSKGRPFRGGPGSDSGRVRTYFGPNGQRIPFAIDLVDLGEQVWSGPVGSMDEAPRVDGLVLNADLHRLECFCGHTESFREGSRASQNAARARMSKHLRKATDEVARHREIHTAEFGTASL